MTEYDRTNSGALFKNDKQGNEKRPDYTGKINVRGVDYYLSAWLKKSKAGNNFMSLAVNEITDSKGQTKQPEQPTAQDDFDDSIPF